MYQPQMVRNVVELDYKSKRVQRLVDVATRVGSPGWTREAAWTVLVVAKLEIFNSLHEDEGREVERLANAAAHIVNGPVGASIVEAQLVLGIVHTLLAFRVMELRRLIVRVTALEPVVAQRSKRRTQSIAEPIRIKPGDGVIETVEARGKAWTAPGLAELIGISKGAVYAAVRSGKLPKIEGTGTSVRICPKAAGQWLRDRKTGLEQSSTPVQPKSRPRKTPPL
jgi:hypothetical protein